MYVIWIVGVVISLNVGLLFSSTGLLGFCEVSIYSAGNDLAGEDSVLPFRVDIVLIFRRGCSMDVGILFFSVGSVGRVKLGDRDEPGGCVWGLFCFASSVSLFIIFAMAVS